MDWKRQFSIWHLLVANIEAISRRGDGDVFDALEADRCLGEVEKLEVEALASGVEATGARIATPSGVPTDQ